MPKLIPYVGAETKQVVRQASLDERVGYLILQEIKDRRVQIAKLSREVTTLEKRLMKLRGKPNAC